MKSIKGQPAVMRLRTGEVEPKPTILPPPAKWFALPGVAEALPVLSEAWRRPDARSRTLMPSLSAAFWQGSADEAAASGHGGCCVAA